MFVEHPLVKKNSVESRFYQESIVAASRWKNTLVVAPTALGKTVIAILLAAHRLHDFAGSKVLMLSTTRPLVNQHAASFRNFLDIPEDAINAFTGFTPPAQRAKLWVDSKVICATPQVVINDLEGGRYSLEDVSLLVIDEAHRCAGNYPYSAIAARYHESAKRPRIIGMTASPGSMEARIKEVKEQLFIENIEIRTEGDSDVRPYIRGVKIAWNKVPLNDEMLKIRVLLEDVVKSRLGKVRSVGLSLSIYPGISKKELLAAKRALQEELESNKSPAIYTALSDVVASMNVLHAIELLETQGLWTLLKFFERLRTRKSKAARTLVEDKKFLRAMRLTENFSQEFHHPKLNALLEIIRASLSKGERTIVFTQYRDSALRIVEELNRVEGARPARFVGQASRGEDAGLSQKEQMDVLAKFRSGEYNVLVATSVAEEGLDIPKVDIVVFYEPIPSEIRSIQRRGRTGRTTAGHAIVLMTEGTRDEGIYWSSYHKEKRMQKILKELKGDSSVGQRSIGDFV